VAGKYRITKCPACGSVDLEIARFRCTQCGTIVEGAFVLSRLANLPEDHLRFVEVFLRCRGNIKEVERELGISYPTVRSRLDRVVHALGYTDGSVPEKRKEILQALEQQEIEPEEAVRALRELGQ